MNLLGRRHRRSSRVHHVLLIAAAISLTGIGGGGRVGTAQAADALPVVAHMATSPHLNSLTGGSEAHGTDNYFSSNMLLLDPPHRRGYELVAWQRDGVPVTEVTVYDLDSLRPLRSGVIDGVAPAGAQGVGSNLPSQGFVATLTSGDAQPRLVFPTFAATARAGVQAYDLVTVDLTSFQVIGDVTLSATARCLTNVFPAPCPVYGVSYDPRSHLVYAVASRSFAGALGVTNVSFVTYAVDPVTSAVVGSANLPSACNQEVTGGGQQHAFQVPIFRSTDGGSLWTVCGASGNGVAAGQFAAVQVPLSAAGLPSTAPVHVYPSGALASSDAYGDPAADRILFEVTVAADRELLVFDGRHASYVGAVGLAPLKANGPYPSTSYVEAGVDPTTGRFYEFSLLGAYLADGRRTDPQGFPQASQASLKRDGGFGIGGGVAVDPNTHHVFTRLVVEPAGGGTPTADAYYTVYQDRLPVSEDVPLSSLDVNTSNIPQVAGSTVAIFAGHAQGFGTRNYQLRFSQIPGSSSANPVPNNDVLEAAATSVGGPGGTELTGNSAAASGAVSDADDQSRKTFTSNTKQSFPYSQHSCQDSTGSPSTSGSTGEPGGSTQQACDLAKGQATVTSAYRASDAAAALPGTSPQESDVTATSALRTDQPTSIGAVPAIVSTATSTVQGIQLAPGVGIAYLQVTATAYAGGRAGTAGTTLTVVLRGVKAGGFSCDANCDPTQALAMISAALEQQTPGQVVVLMPGADPTAAAGTPHGYYASVLKDTYRLLNDQTLYADGRPEVVGLQVIRNGGSTAGGLTDIQITEYAGVEVESRYGVSLLQLGAPLTGTGAITAGINVPGSAGVAGQFIPANAAAATGAGDGTRSGNGAAGGPLAAIVNGLAWLLDWTQLPLMSLMWTVLLLPAYLATRRHRLEALTL
jgi:hypothetical protein